MNVKPENFQVEPHAARGFRAVPEWLWAPSMAGALMLFCGLAGLATGQMWLFPGLGPTALLQALYPRQISARFYNVLVGHALGIGAAALAVWIFNLDSETTVLAQQQLTWPKAWASALAVTLMVYLQMLLQATHPPAAATALLLTLGLFPTALAPISVLLCAVLLLALVGEFLRRVRVN